MHRNAEAPWFIYFNSQFTYPLLVVAVTDVGCVASLLKALTLISTRPLDVVMTIDLVTL